MDVDVIIFDKDGTLLDFDAFWVTVSIKAIESVVKQFGKEDALVEKILKAFGVHNGVTDINGVLCKGTYEQMGQIVYKILSESGCEISCDEVIKAVVSSYNAHFEAGEVKPTCQDLVDVLKELKRRNKKLVLVTTDNDLITYKCLETLGIEKMFDRIYTDDGKTPTKPNPYCVFDLCEVFNVEKERIVMVGDTMTDVNFAGNAGIAVIGIAKNDYNRAILAPYADGVVSEISQILDILE